MPKTSFIVVVDHDDDFDPKDMHTLISEAIEDDAMGGSEHTSAMNSVETITGYECDECSMPFDPETLTDVMIIDGDHDDQPMEIIKICPGCMGQVWSDGWGYTNGYASPEDYELDESGEWRLKNEEE